MISEFIEYAVLAVLALIPIANPFSTAPLFLGLTSKLSDDARDRVALRASIYMASTLLLFLLAGSIVLSFFGITISSLRIAGGLIIAFIGFRMLFPPPSDTPSDESPAEGGEIAFTPLAVPMLSGPGSIAVVIGMSAEVAAHEVGDGRLLGYLAVAIAILITALLAFLVLKASTRVVRFMGDSGINAMTRVMGFFLICIGVEFIIGALATLFPELALA
ncbi:MAG: MarC family NAAT transporter [Limibacillus sp.]